MEYKEVESSSVKRIGYDAPSQTLEVTFASARTYRYSGVPTEVANAFLNAKSKGLFVATDLRDKYPAGRDPFVLGESVNTLTTYGFDPATGMQEPKATLCQIRAA